MSIVQDVITPIVIVVVGLFIVLGVVYLLYWIMRRLNLKIGNFWKFKIRKKKFDEKKVKICYEVILSGGNVVDLRRLVLIQTGDPKILPEFEYIFNELKKIERR